MIQMQPSKADVACRLENFYYDAKALKDSDPGAAHDGFQAVFGLSQLEGPAQREWAFRALKQIVKLNLRCGDPDGIVAGKHGRLLNSGYTISRTQAILQHTLIF